MPVFKLTTRAIGAPSRVYVCPTLDGAIRAANDHFHNSDDAYLPGNGVYVLGDPCVRGVWNVWLGVEFFHANHSTVATIREHDDI